MKKKSLLNKRENSSDLISNLGKKVGAITPAALLTVVLLSSCGKNTPEEDRIETTEQTVQILEDELDYSQMDVLDGTVDVNDYMGQIVTIDAQLDAIENNVEDMKVRINEYNAMLTSNRAVVDTTIINSNIRNLEQAIEKAQDMWGKLLKKKDVYKAKLKKAEQEKYAGEVNVDNTMDQMKSANKQLRDFGKHSKRRVSSHDHTDPETE